MGSPRFEFSIVIPVLHEADRINALLGSLYDVTSKGCEVIVVDGDPKGDTIRVVRGTATCIVSAGGRARQMNAGAALARGDILIFLHADTQLPANALDRIRSVMSQNAYVGGAFDLGIDSDRIALKLVSFGASLRSRVTRIPYGDQAIFIRRAHFNQLRGYRELPLMEDIELMRRLKKRGDKICILRDRVSTSAQRWEKEGVLRCTLRNWALSALYFAGIPPSRLARFYGSGGDVYAG